MIGRAPSAPTARDAGSSSTPAVPTTKKLAVATASVAPSATRAREATISPALTLASMRVRSVCFSFSSAIPYTTVIPTTMPMAMASALVSVKVCST